MTTKTDTLAGEYRLTAAVWNERTAPPGQVDPAYRARRRGELVTLGHDDALRMLRSGSVEPTGSTEKAVAAATAAGMLAPPRRAGWTAAGDPQPLPAVPVSALTVDPANPHAPWRAPAGWRY